jgi:hypothetical protein
MKKTHDGLYVKIRPERGALWLVVCHDDVAGGLAGAYVERGDDVAMRNTRRRLIRRSRKMLRGES